VLSQGPHDVESFSFENHHFLVVSEDRDEETVEIYSSIYFWSNENNMFEVNILDTS